MNDLYNQTIEVNGKTYHYDPDRDIYYARTEESTISKWAWLVLVIVLSIAAIFLEYQQGLV